jgi:hypothetical protein
MEMFMTFNCNLRSALGATLALLLATGSLTLAAQSAPKAAPSAPDAKQDHPHFTSNKHLDKGLDCTACHGEGPKKPVKGEQCLSCHQSFDEVAKRTQDMEPNPHDNHQTINNIDCTECHKGHKPDQVFCQQCHGDMQLKRNSKK